MADLAEYRYEILKQTNRDSDRKPVLESTGWSLVKYPDSPESYEPMDSDVVGSNTQSDFKEYNGFIICDGNFNEVTGGNVGNPRG